MNTSLNRLRVCLKEEVACTVGIRLGQVTTADLMEKTQDELDSEEAAHRQSL